MVLIVALDQIFWYYNTALDSLNLIIFKYIIYPAPFNVDRINVTELVLLLPCLYSLYVVFFQILFINIFYVHKIINIFLMLHF